MNRPLVSVIVPSFNQGRYLGATVESILTQHYRPIEVLVMDGASTDESVDILRRYSHWPELQWWSEPDRGVTDAVNKGLGRANGEILAIQSSDDLYMPGAVAAAVAALTADDRVGLVYGDAEYINSESRVIGGTSLPPFNLDDYLGKRTFVMQAAAFFTRAAAEVAGPWRAEVSYAADAEFFLRIATTHRVLKLDRKMALYRYHETQRDKAAGRIALDWERVVRDWLAANEASRATRRRALAGIQLTRAHYLSDEQWVPRTAALYRALLHDPTLFGFDSFPMLELIPGRQPILKLLSKFKRALGFRPRGT